ncbi:MAG: hypothetical protein GY811_05830 [Myxococcales bacterium]|nr:hypothetical protein [Myxococcales bacterium]
MGAGTNTGSRLLFLNRCEGGCTISPGFEDSRSNHSSIVGSPRELSEWPHTDNQWDSMKRCDEELYAPFEIRVTDTDPGDEPHYEAIVAGSGSELGFPMAGGVAPFACGPIENAISFTFALLYDDMRALCNVVGQESAHAFGLDHEMQCNDPLTYLGGCPNRKFQDVDAPCGEFAARDCDCGVETQNSYQYLLEFLGEGLVPQVTIQTPEDRALLPVGFPVHAEGIDDIAVTRSELWIDDRRIETLEQEPFAFTAPRTLAPGAHTVEVRIFDDRNQYGSTAIEIEQAACESRSDCDFAHICVDGLCVLGPGNAAGIGATCSNSDSCQTKLCAVDAPGHDGVCAATCENSPDSCPSAFHCVTAQGGRRRCIPENGGSGGFCQAGGHGGRGAFWLFLVALFIGRRRCGKGDGDGE